MTVWLITGCSSGLGKEIALAALKKGDIVLATCRGDVTRLADLERAGAIILELDISAPPGEIQEFCKNTLELQVVKENGGIDKLVNNAGYVQMGVAEEISEDILMKSFNTNFFGHVTLTRALLPSFRVRRSGAIAFIGSRGGFMKIPGLSAYSAAKYATAGYAEALAAELEPFNIRVTCIEPGDFRTVVFKGNHQEPQSRIDDYKGTRVDEVFERLDHSFEQPGDPAKGARRIVDLLSGDWPGSESGKKIPARLALGEDAYGTVKKIYNGRLQENEEWREWTCGVNFD